MTFDPRSFCSGFEQPTTRVVLRNMVLDLEDEERQLAVEAQARYPLISAAELDEGVRRMRADAERGQGEWVDPRPTTFISARKPSARVGKEVRFFHPSVTHMRPFPR